MSLLNGRYNCLYVLVGLCLWSPLVLNAHAQASSSKDQPIKILTTTNYANPSSFEVRDAFRKKVASHPKLLTMEDMITSTEPNLMFMLNCLDRNSTYDGYTCSYTTHQKDGPTETFIGSGVYTAKSADGVADQMFSTVAEGVVAEWHFFTRANALNALNTCLVLTQSRCAVPDILVPELHARVLNFSQYLQKGGLKK
jgi:hypothetical protein